MHQWRITINRTTVVQPPAESVTVTIPYSLAQIFVALGGRVGGTPNLDNPRGMFDKMGEALANNGVTHPTRRIVIGTSMSTLHTHGAFYIDWEKLSA